LPQIILPDFPNTSEATVGKDYLIFIKTGAATLEASTYKLIGGQRGGDRSVKANEIDASDKTSDGWGSFLPGTKEWTIDLDQIAILNDEGADTLMQALLNDKKVYILQRHASGKAVKGWMSCLEQTLGSPHDDVGTISGSLKGVGKPEFVDNEPDPLAEDDED
jgi:predicted secreted protein